MSSERLPMSDFLLYKRGTPKVLGVVSGPPGTGKSTLIGGMAEVGPTLLVATLGREAESWKYHEMGVPTILIEDTEWKPDRKQYSATAYPRLLELAEALIDDDLYDCIGFDSGTELGEIAWHASLAAMGNYGSPSEIENDKSRFLPYENLDNKMDQIIKSFAALTTQAKRPKHVMFSWHLQPLKEDQVAGKGDNATVKQSSDSRGEGVEYEGTMLPMIRGKFRRRVNQAFNTVVYTDMSVTTKMGASLERRETVIDYRIQVRSDQERHCKIPGPLPAEKYIPNSFPRLMELVVAGLEAEKAEAEVAEAAAPKRASTLRRSRQ